MDKKMFVLCIYNYAFLNFFSKIVILGPNPN